MIGRSPFVTCHGNLMPCCWLDIPRYSSDNKIKEIGGNFIKNIFLDPKFDLNNNSYKDIVQSDEWLLALEKLFIMNYSTCDVKCGDYVVMDNKIVHSEIEIDKKIFNNEKIQKSNFLNFFNKNIIDTWEIDNIQLELTNKCSLKCSYCPRLIDSPKKSDLNIKILDDILSCKPWNRIQDVGSYGDTMFYKPYHDFLRLLVDNNIKYYSGHFAATGKGKKWWVETINLYEKVIKSGTKVVIFFGIDGLEDTSKLHRIGQDWDEITFALKRCVEANCEVVWQYIPMSFNEHQINTAKELAQKWGCKFHLTLSSRFTPNDPNTPKNKNLYKNNEYYKKDKI